MGSKKSVITPFNFDLYVTVRDYQKSIFNLEVHDHNSQLKDYNINRKSDKASRVQSQISIFKRVVLVFMKKILSQLVLIFKNEKQIIGLFV